MHTLWKQKARQVSGRFFVKKLRKKLLSWGYGSGRRQRPLEQKFFAELFFKKATACLLCAVSLTLFGRPSHAQLLDSLLPESIPGYGTQFAVIVNNRTHSPPATGIQLGAFSARPEVAFREGYDTAPNGAAGSSLSGLTPSLLLTDPLLGFAAYAAGDFTIYPENTSQNTNSLTLGAGQRVALPDHLITVSAGYIRTQETGFALDTIAIPRPIAFTVSDIRASDLASFGLFTLKPAASATQYRFPNNAAGNRIDTREALTGAYLPGGPIQILVRLQETQSTYRESLFDSETDQLLAGLVDTADGLWTVSALAGAARRRPRFGGTVSAPVLEAGLDWRPSDLDRIRVTLAREIDDPDEVSATAYTLTQAKFSATHGCAGGVTASLSAQGSNAAFFHSALRETLVSTDANLAVPLGQNLAFTADYSFNTRQANALRAANEHIFTLTLAWSL